MSVGLIFFPMDLKVVIQRIYKYVVILKYIYFTF